MNDQEADDLLTKAAANALIYGCGFIKVAHTNGSFELSVVPIEEYKYLRIDERGLVDFVEVKE